MDVERTMEFILQMQAKSEARMAKYDERMAKADERMDKSDKRLEATRKLVETGMRMLVRIEKSQNELTVKLTALTGRVDTLAVHLDALTGRVDALTIKVSALTEAQRKSDRKFERFMDSWT